MRSEFKSLALIKIVQFLVIVFYKWINLLYWEDYLKYLSIRVVFRKQYIIVLADAGTSLNVRLTSFNLFAGINGDIWKEFPEEISLPDSSQDG